MPTQAELEESRARFAEREQKIYDMYFRLFNSALGKEVLVLMRERAWYHKSTMEGEGRQRGIRDAREGQRMFMLVTDDFIEKGRIGFRPPTQVEAVRNVTGVINVT